MRRRSRFHHGNGSAILFLILLAFATWLLIPGAATRTELAVATASAFRSPAGGPQLVSIEPLPIPEGEMCEWMPASATGTLSAALQRTPPTASGATESPSTTSTEVDRNPLRVIRDTYPTYSAVAVDTRVNEVFLQDENLFSLRVFNRLDNTPPGAKFTEPKRVLGGLRTKIEFNCGLYIDPKSGDVYSVDNDTGDALVVFPNSASGDVPPARELHVPHRAWGVAVDEEAQELYLTIQYPAQVVVYRKTAKGEDKPLRVLEGEHTRMADAHGIAIDTKNGWLFVSNHGSDSKWNVPGSGTFNAPSISVYPLKANGDVPPLRVIQGPKARLNWPASLAVDPERGELFVANDADDSVTVFRETSTGDSEPSRIIAGSKTGLKNPTGVFVDSKNQELWVSNMGNHSATVYALDAAGNVSPRRTIRSGPLGQMALAIGNPGAVAYDSKRDEILVPN